MTVFQVEASAKAPWTRTTVGLGACGSVGAASVFVGVRARVGTAVTPRGVRRQIDCLAMVMSASVKALWLIEQLSPATVPIAPVRPPVSPLVRTFERVLDASWTLLIVFAAQTLSWMGLPVIGTAALGSAGVLASQGKLSVWPLLVAGIAGAQVGGIIGWRLGSHLASRQGHKQHKDTRFARRGREAVHAGRELDQRYGDVMVLFVSSWISGTLG